MQEYEQLAAELGTVLFQTKIRDGLAAAEYTNRQIALIRYAPKSSVAKAYIDFADELLEKLNMKVRG